MGNSGRKDGSTISFLSSTINIEKKERKLETNRSLNLKRMEVWRKDTGYKREASIEGR